MTERRSTMHAGSEVLKGVALQTTPRVLTRRRSVPPGVVHSHAPTQCGQLAPPAPMPGITDVSATGGAANSGAGIGTSWGDEIERAIRQGFEQGLAQGTRQGYDQGFEQGSSEGRVSGAQEGREAGYAAGMQGARVDVEAQIVDLRNRANALLEQLHTERTTLREAAESDMVELVFTAICRIAGEGAINRDGARAMIRHAIQQASPARVLRVRVHPDDLGWLSAAPVGEDPEWVGDDAVTLGGCIVETDAGTLDARLEAQLRAVSTALGDVRKARAAGSLQAHQARPHA
ncbi:FliH/SctL family protein [Pandoraea pnomenusa]|uniref:FliH/SctL family protein n=1 Tax=Pandoraea pnomenusa TaxID=93220 RepID=UPI0015EE7CAC|nr:FliH/SctL family protein [Pandoraea pnomenusa]